MRQTRGLIETLAAGYGAVHRRPLAIGIPAALSSYLWLGGALTLAGPPAAGDELAAQLLGTLAATDARTLLTPLNLVPVLTPGVQAAAEPIELGGGALAAAVAGLNLAALLLSGLFLALLGAAVTGERASLWGALRRGGRAAGRIGLALLAIGAVGLLLGLPFLAVSALLLISLPAAAPAISGAWLLALLAGYLYAGFMPEAVLLSDAGALRAIAQSVRLVRANLAATAGLLAISALVGLGLGGLWRGLALQPGWLLPAIVGSAYISSGLSAARMVFYRERQALGQPTATG